MIYRPSALPLGDVFASAQQPEQSNGADQKIGAVQVKTQLFCGVDLLISPATEALLRMGGVGGVRFTQWQGRNGPVMTDTPPPENSLPSVRAIAVCAHAALKEENDLSRGATG